jgi:hypothetical protein
MMETDSRYSLSEMSGPRKTQPSSASMSEFRGSVPDQLPSFHYRLRNESPLAGSNRGDQLSLALVNRTKIQQLPNE